MIAKHSSAPVIIRATAFQRKMALLSLNLDLPVRWWTFERALLFLFLLSLPLVNPWIRGDGVGYYAYARAPLIEHSLDFTHDYQGANESFREGRLDESGQPKAGLRTVTGHLDNHFTVGPALLWSPFLLVAHAGVLLAKELGSSVRADGFSAPYRYAMALGTAIYGFLALFFAFRLARKYVDPLWAFIATLTIWWASSLPVYMYFNPAWSHAHSAFTAALFLWYWERTRQERTVQQWLVLGLIAGLMLNVYYPNLMLVAVVVLEALWQYLEYFRAARATGRSGIVPLFSRQLLFGVVVCVCLLPTFVSRWIVYGGPFETGYLPIRDFLWNSPVFLKVLLSANHGLLSWTPVLIFSLLGLVLLARRLPRLGAPFFAAAFAFYLFISIYPDWAGISSFGNRFFISLTSLFIFGLAITLESFAAWFSHKRPALLVSTVVLACFTLWNLGMIYQWGTHLIPARGPISFSEAASNQFRVVPRQISSHLHSYFFRRGDMMRQIEEKDIEQLKKDAQP
jgi:Dolichyl-phosphate-mannose-protein mannosyltransferase